MISIKKIVIVLSLSIVLSAQNSITEILHEKFTNASSMAIDETGFIYIADTEENTVAKYDTLGNLINSIGGFGWDKSTFDMPVDIFYQNLSLYVVDMNNHRIQIFDRQLNYISQIDGHSLNDEYVFSYPTKLTVSHFGDVFVIDSENLRIIKLLASGEVLNKFGDYDSGEFVLSNPLDICLTNDLKLVILEEDKLLFFDIFGNGTGIYESSSDYTRLATYGNALFCLSRNLLYKYTLNSSGVTANPQEIVIPITDENAIKDIAINNSALYILTENSLFKIDNFIKN